MLVRVDLPDPTIEANVTGPEHVREMVGRMSSMTWLVSLVLTIPPKSQLSVLLPLLVVVVLPLIVLLLLPRNMFCTVM